MTRSPAVRRRGFRVLLSDHDLIEKLSPIHQAVLRAHGSYQQIGQLLGIPTGTVKSRLCRAREALEVKRIHAKACEQDPADETHGASHAE